MPTYYVTDDLNKKGRPFKAKSVSEARAKVDRLANKLGKPLHLFYDKTIWNKVGRLFASNPKRTKRAPQKKALKRGQAIRVPGAGTVTISKDGAVIFRGTPLKPNPTRRRRKPAARKTTKRKATTSKKRAAKRTTRRARR